MQNAAGKGGIWVCFTIRCTKTGLASVGHLVWPLKRLNVGLVGWRLWWILVHPLLCLWAFFPSAPWAAGSPPPSAHPISLFIFLYDVSIDRLTSLLPPPSPPQKAFVLILSEEGYLFVCFQSHLGAKMVETVIPGGGRMEVPWQEKEACHHYFHHPILLRSSMVSINMALNFMLSFNK